MKALVDLIKLLISRTIFKLVPVKKGRFVFSSYHGHYSHSPKYISEYLQTLKLDIEIVWLVKRQYKKNVPEGIKTIDVTNRLLSLLYLGSAEVIIDNVYCDKDYTWYANDKFGELRFRLISYLLNKPKQRAFTTLHGSIPLKKSDRDKIGSNILNFTCPNTTIILENEYTAEIERHITFNNVPVIVLGGARDIINNEKNEIIKSRLSIPSGKKIVLYAPTFRNNGRDTENRNVFQSGINQMAEINIEEMLSSLSNKFGGDWSVVLRFHQNVQELVDWNSLYSIYGDSIINGNLCEDMGEYMKVADILLTDYSSCMFDFMLLNKPCFLYIPDIENYASIERGLYMNIEDLPFPHSKTPQQLFNTIDCFDLESYTKQVSELIESFGFSKEKEPTKAIVNYILSHRA